MNPKERIAQIQAEKQSLAGEDRVRIERELTHMLVKVYATGYEPMYPEPSDT